MWLQHSDEPQQTMQMRLSTKDPRQTETWPSKPLSGHQKNGIIINKGVWREWREGEGGGSHTYS